MLTEEIPSMARRGRLGLGALKGLSRHQETAAASAGMWVPISDKFDLFVIFGNLLFQISHIIS